MTKQQSLQDRFAPNLMCFGCGPANQKGLQIKSFVNETQGKQGHDNLVAEFRPQPFHLAFEGMLNGGIIGTIMDCHCNWAAAWHLMKVRQLETPPCTVTAEYKISFSAPTPMNQLLQLKAFVLESTDRKAIVKGTLSAEGKETAICDATFCIGETRSSCLPSLVVTKIYGRATLKSAPMSGNLMGPRKG